MKRGTMLLAIMMVSIAGLEAQRGSWRTACPFEPEEYSLYGYDTYVPPFTYSLPYTYDYLPYRSYNSFFAYAPGNYYYTFR